MISKLKIHGPASYKDSVEITDIKKFNFFYGLNGTGKTTIANYLDCDIDDTNYSGCTTWPERIKDTHQIFVYNQKYIDRVFRRNPEQPGIFSLGEKDVEAEKKIEEAEEKKKQLQQKIEPVSATISVLREELKNSEKRIQNEIWNKEDPRKIVGSLEYCLKGAKQNKEKFFNQISNTSLPDNEISDSLQDLEEEADKLEDGDFKEKPIFETLNVFSDIEGEKILSQKIVGKSDSYLTELIEELENFIWVKEGIKSYLNRSTDCPFCQQEIEEERRIELNKLIDDKYSIKEAALKSLQEKYKLQAEKVSRQLSRYKLDDDLKSRDDFGNLIELLEQRLKSNLLKLQNKIDDTSLPVELDFTTDLTDKINKITNAQNSINSSFNSRVSGIKEYKKDINERFWIVIRQKYDLQIKEFVAEQNAKEAKLAEKIKEEDALNEKIKAQKKIISINRLKNSTLTKSIEQINTQLKYVGFEGFFIRKADGESSKYYKLERPNEESDNTFNSLSEGEKTIITFLYFIQQCLGAEEEDENPDLSQRIVVIDDPISSLSFPLVFDVAHLIKNNFLYKETDFAQIFIFTHHLYFYHELIEKNYINGDFKAYFRVTKNKSSSIEQMSRDEIKNSYQSYWIVLKDIIDGKTTRFALPNTMRNILEHYFSFIDHKNSWKSALNELCNDNQEDNSYKTLQRYLDRESHSDPTNLVDSNEFDVNRFLICFREIFKKTRHLKHYKKMMGEDEAANSNQIEASA